MKAGYNLSVFAAILLCGTMLFYSPSAEAQFLNKLSKGLEKINKALDSIGKDGESDNNKSDSSSKNASSSAGTVNGAKPSEASTPATQDQPNTYQQDLAIIEKYKDSKLPYNVPHFTDSTRFLLLDKNEFEIFGGLTPYITDVHEGWFAIKNNKNLWSFFSAENGQCLFRNIGKTPFNNNDPHFDNGVALVEDKTDKGVDVHKILYSDGRVKFVEYKIVEDFVDGISMVKSFDAKYIPSAFYINSKGEKIYPEFTEVGKSISSLVDTREVRPLCDGLRAMKISGKWGYVDGNGTIKIKPQFYSVKDFSEGCAWVNVEESGSYKIGLIDTKGNWIIKPVFKGYSMEISDNFGNASCGLLRVVGKNDTVVYYNTSGKEIKRFDKAYATSFVNGYAFLKKDGWSYVINTDMEAVKRFKDEYGFWDITHTKPAFKNYPLALVNHNRCAATPNGEVVLRGNDDMKISVTLKEFSADGYAYAETSFGDNTVKGFIRPDGEYTVVISTKPEDNRIWQPGPGSPWKPGPRFPDPEPEPKPPLPNPPDDIPTIIGDMVKYNVTTVACPAEGGSINPGGKVEYGDVFTAKATAAPNWKLSSVTSSSNRGKTYVPNVFKVYEDMTVTANFIPKDTVKSPERSGAWIGDYNFSYATEDEIITEKIPLYVELKQTPAVSTPYGDKYGFITLYFDPEKQYRAINRRKPQSGGVTYNMMFAPMAVDGMIERNGKKYLLISGGEIKRANILVSGEGNDALSVASANIMLLLFGNQVNLGKGTYMLEYDYEGNNLRLGSMLRFHTVYGWLSADDERFIEFGTSGIIWGLYSGFASDYFAGYSLAPSEIRNDVVWYPPRSWVFENSEEHKRVKEKFDYFYKNFVSDYFGFWNDDNK